MRIIRTGKLEYSKEYNNMPKKKMLNHNVLESKKIMQIRCKLDNNEAYNHKEG